MILNFRKAGLLEHQYVGGRVLVDGKEIELAWYVDTIAGIVKSYPDLTLRSRNDVAALMLADPSVEILDERHGLVSRTVYGKVELFTA